MWERHRLFWVGVGVAATFWLLEAAIHTWFFAEGGGWMSNLLPIDANEWWMRSLAGSLIVGFGAFADRASGLMLRAEEQRRMIQTQLDNALTHALRDYLPICAHCKAIREGEAWSSLETYISGRTKTQFSHGLCPRCLPLFEESGEGLATVGVV